MTTATVYLSKKGLKELKKESTKLEHERHDILQTLRDLDKSDNHEEQLARSEHLAALEAVEGDLAEKLMTIKNAKLYPRKRDALKVAIGSVVDLLDTKGRIVRYTIVDSIEASPLDGRISVKSPLGRNLLNKQLKDVVEWTAKFGTRKLQLVAIS